MDRSMADEQTESKKWTKQATERVFSALNRADEIGGEVRDFLQDRVATDPRYIKARKGIAKCSTWRPFASLSVTSASSKVGIKPLDWADMRPTCTGMPKALLASDSRRGRKSSIRGTITA